MTTTLRHGAIVVAVAMWLRTGSDAVAQPTAPAPAPPTPPPVARPAQPAGPDMNAYYQVGNDALPREGVPKGQLRGPLVLPNSQAYPGTQHTYWVHVPAQYDPATPASLMIFQDGQAFIDMNGVVRAPNVLDNLIYRRELPVLITVFINPGRTPEQPEPTPSEWGDRTSNRPTEYNSLNVRLMQALTEKGYDLNYAWGINTHGQRMGGPMLPEMMRWLWRDHPVSTDAADMVERSFNEPTTPRPKQP